MRHTYCAVAALLLAGCAGGGGAGDPEPDGGIVDNFWVEVTPKTEGDGPVTTMLATVRHLDLEGGLFVIQDAGGNNYNPTNLPAEFREDGKVVEVEVRRRDDVASIGMVGPMVDVLRIRDRSASSRPGAGAGDAGQAGSPGLAGTRWRLEDLAGTGVIDDVRASLEFAEDGAVSGSGTCNNFRGRATISGDAITFGPLATTRKMCPEALMNQESAYLAALGAAERYEVSGGMLLVHVSERSAPLRFSPE